MPRRYHPLSPEQYSNLRIRSRGYLPHWEVDESIYFITYRLHDSLPEQVARMLLDDRRRLRKALMAEGHVPGRVLENQVAALFGRRLDQELHKGYGQCHIRDPRIASTLMDNLLHHSGPEGRYELIAASAMPNHVHVLVLIHDGRELANIVHSWKSFTSKQANRILGRRGIFWQQEYFDRVVRNADDLEETRRYVLENPVMAGLRDWSWLWPR